ncbi:hypothetical protein CsSME_00025150 [Camellia sinensis var. sinensis]
MGFYLFALWECLGSTKGDVGYASELAGCSDWTSAPMGVGVGPVLLDVAYLMWLVWLEQNRRTFQEVYHGASWLESRLLVVLYSWMERNVDPNTFVFLDFLDDVIG